MVKKKFKVKEDDLVECFYEDVSYKENISDEDMKFEDPLVFRIFGRLHTLDCNKVIIVTEDSIYADSTDENHDCYILPIGCVVSLHKVSRVD